MKKVLLMFILVLFLVTFVSAGLFQKDNNCGDGTLEGDCSVNQPYFCSEGVLVEKASLCGCVNLTNIEDESCISFYQFNPKEVNFTYFLNGKEKNISFTVYGNLTDYLFELPDFISYSNGEKPLREDFKFIKINEENQKILLMPLVIQIQNLASSKTDQARIAISLVQNIPFGNSDEQIFLGNNSINYSRYPYEVLYEQEGVCASKSELLVFLLREIGYETVFFYHKLENHDSVGIKCPEKYGLLDTSYCFVETTGPSIITDNENSYLGGLKLTSYPEIINSSEGDSFGYLYEYGDARAFKKIRKGIEETGKTNLFRRARLNKIIERYGL
ncbi:hypothetical protein KAI04_01400 [Candidatus Pacearchaeota archaeon]|nr:hypothetical protein [Candidatus Pacearchaeota archaeon]